MNKIAYLFGAGASRMAVPIVDEIPKRLNERINFLSNETLRLSDSQSYNDVDTLETRWKIQLRLIQDLTWLLRESERHASVDTFAKKLFVKNETDNLLKLKIALSIFLLFEQFEKKPDSRYDTFFASILKNSYDEFPENMRILSWNYDSQFELAFSDYSNSLEFSRNQRILNINSKFEPERVIDNKFSIYKLNGTTGFYSELGNKQYKFTDEISGKINTEVIDRITHSYAHLIFNSTKLFPSLSFAWEEDLTKNSIIRRAIQSLEGASVLVIIGYSFPYFNRDVDKLIINSLKNLQKVYFQSPEASIIKERFLSVCDNADMIELILRTDTGQFLLPKEF